VVRFGNFKVETHIKTEITNGNFNFLRNVITNDSCVRIMIYVSKKLLTRDSRPLNMYGWWGPLLLSTSHAFCQMINLAAEIHSR